MKFVLVVLFVALAGCGGDTQEFAAQADSVVVGDITVPVTDRGQGPAILFLHGVPESRHCWDDIIDQLPEYRSIAPDLPGFGGSAPLPERYDFTIPVQREFLERFVEVMKIDEPFILVVHDIGAVAGLPYAVANPDRIAGILFMNTGAFRRDYEWHTFAKIWANPIGGPLFMWIANRAMMHRMLAGEDEAMADAHADRLFRHLTPVARQSIMALYRKMTKPEFFADHIEGVEALGNHVPLRMLWGRNDAYSPFVATSPLASDARVVDDSGHWLPLHRPDLVVEEIRSLVKRSESLRR